MLPLIGRLATVAVCAAAFWAVLGLRPRCEEEECLPSAEFVWLFYTHVLVWTGAALLLSVAAVAMGQAWPLRKLSWEAAQHVCVTANLLLFVANCAWFAPDDAQFRGWMFVAKAGLLTWLHYWILGGGHVYHALTKARVLDQAFEDVYDSTGPGYWGFVRSEKPHAFQLACGAYAVCYLSSSMLRAKYPVPAAGGVVFGSIGVLCTWLMLMLKLRDWHRQEMDKLDPAKERLLKPEDGVA